MVLAFILATSLAQLPACVDARLAFDQAWANYMYTHGYVMGAYDANNARALSATPPPVTPKQKAFYDGAQALQENAWKKLKPLEDAVEKACKL